MVSYPVHVAFYISSGWRSERYVGLYLAHERVCWGYQYPIPARLKGAADVEELTIFLELIIDFLYNSFIRVKRIVISLFVVFPRREGERSLLEIVLI